MAVGMLCGLYWIDHNDWQCSVFHELCFEEHLGKLGLGGFA